jgi:hypothetical protein
VEGAGDEEKRNPKDVEDVSWAIGMFFFIFFFLLLAKMLGIDY